MQVHSNISPDGSHDTAGSGMLSGPVLVPTQSAQDSGDPLFPLPSLSSPQPRVSAATMNGVISARFMSQGYRRKSRLTIDERSDRHCREARKTAADFRTFSPTAGRRRTVAVRQP